MIGKNFKITTAEFAENRHSALFRYEIETDEKSFHLEERIEFPNTVPDCYEADQILRALHIALSTSYYKSFYPPNISHPYEMSELEAEYWNGVFRNGLAEFIYTNMLEPNKLAQFTHQVGDSSTNKNRIDFTDSALLGIGGGKDSIVAGELLKESEIKLKGFVLSTGEEIGQSKIVAETMGVELLQVKRFIDKQILEINQIDGAFNGHIPISLIFSLVGAMLATIEKSKYIVVANEASSSIPQASMKGDKVNHQWSKSLQFERLMQDYIHAYISEELFYFSAIRPLTSVAVSKIFSQYLKYLEVFSSDNSLLKINQAEREHPRWSKDSSKSLSSYILMSPWIDRDSLVIAFGRNFLDLPELQGVFSALLSENGEYVLDCVGTPEELRVSLGVAFEQGKFNNSVLMKYASDHKLLGDSSWLSSLLAFDEHAIPEGIKEKLLKKMESKL